MVPRTALDFIYCYADVDRIPEVLFRCETLRLKSGGEAGGNEMNCVPSPHSMRIWYQTLPVHDLFQVGYFKFGPLGTTGPGPERARVNAFLARDTICHTSYSELIMNDKGEGRREDALVKERQAMRDEYERKKEKLISETEKSRPSHSRFVGQNDSMEDSLKKSTVGLVRLEDFMQRRIELEEAKAREAARSGELKYVSYISSIRPDDLQNVEMRLERSKESLRSGRRLPKLHFHLDMMKKMTMSSLGLQRPNLMRKFQSRNVFEKIPESTRLSYLIENERRQNARSGKS